MKRLQSMVYGSAATGGSSNWKEVERFKQIYHSNKDFWRKSAHDLIKENNLIDCGHLKVVLVLGREGVGKSEVCTTLSNNETIFKSGVSLTRTTDKLQFCVCEDLLIVDIPGFGSKSSNYVHRSEYWFMLAIQISKYFKGIYKTLIVDKLDRYLNTDDLMYMVDQIYDYNVQDNNFIVTKENCIYVNDILYASGTKNYHYMHYEYGIKLGNWLPKPELILTHKDCSSSDDTLESILGSKYKILKDKFKSIHWVNSKRFNHTDVPDNNCTKVECNFNLYDVRYNEKLTTPTSSETSRIPYIGTIKPIENNSCIIL